MTAQLQLFVGLCLKLVCSSHLELFNRQTCLRHKTSPIHTKFVTNNSGFSASNKNHQNGVVLLSISGIQLKYLHFVMPLIEIY